MDREELREKLVKKGFAAEHESEYHRDVFVNHNYPFIYEGKILSLDIEVRVDMYTVMLIWYHRKGCKVSKSYYLKNDVSYLSGVDLLFASFVRYCVDIYGISV